MDYSEYLRLWKERTENRPGHFSQNAQDHIFISWEAHEGFKFTHSSAIEATMFLLEGGMEFVLSERFCQEPFKEYFGKQHQLRRSDNIHKSGCNGTTIRIQRSISYQSWNSRGGKQKERAWEQVTDAKLQCGTKPKTNQGWVQYLEQSLPSCSVMKNYYKYCIRQRIEQIVKYESSMTVVVVGCNGGGDQVGNPQPTAFSDCPAYYFKFIFTSLVKNSWQNRK